MNRSGKLEKEASDIRRSFWKMVTNFTALVALFTTIILFHQHWGTISKKNELSSKSSEIKADVQSLPAMVEPVPAVVPQTQETASLSSNPVTQGQEEPPAPQPEIRAEVVTPPVPSPDLAIASMVKKLPRKVVQGRKAGPEEMFSDDFIPFEKRR